MALTTAAAVGPARALYVASAPRSGSTLFDRLLGNHSRITGVGEVFKLHQTPDERTCACGEIVRECPFWSAVAETLARREGVSGPWRWEAFPVERIEGGRGRRVKRFPDPSAAALALGGGRLLRPLARLSATAREHWEAAENSWRLFDAVVETRGTAVVVDSSKNAVRMKKLHAVRPDAFRIVHLVRDGRANLASIRRTFPDRTAARAARDWARQVRNVRAMLRGVPAERVLLVRYEDLCDDPAGTLAGVCAFAGLDFEPGMERLFERELHEIPGNPMLFRGDREIVKDERWRDELDASDLAAFDRAAGGFNRAIGYGR